ncbi:hypothetical protein STEG23_003375 [Scotinomys teguina]
MVRQAKVGGDGRQKELTEGDIWEKNIKERERRRSIQRRKRTSGPASQLHRVRNNESNDSSKLSVVSYEYIVRTAVDQDHTTLIQMQEGMDAIRGDKGWGTSDSRVLSLTAVTLI